MSGVCGALCADGTTCDRPSLGGGCGVDHRGHARAGVSPTSTGDARTAAADEANWTWAQRDALGDYEGDIWTAIDVLDGYDGDGDEHFDTSRAVERGMLAATRIQSLPDCERKTAALDAWAIAWNDD